MKSQRLLARRGKFIYFFFTFLFCLHSFKSFSQPCTTIAINNSCTSSYTYNNGINCPTFTNTCSSTSGWTATMGTPEIVYVPPSGGTAGYYYAGLYSLEDYTGEGMFYPFNFVKGQNYTVTVDGYSQGGLQLYAANGLVQSWNSLLSNCQGPIPGGIADQSIGLTPETFSVTTSPPMSFTANANYSQLWLVVNMGTQATTEVLSIEICPNCSLAAPTNLGTINNATTLTWQPVANATSYVINISETHNGTVTNSKLTSTYNGVNYCPSSGDQVSYTVTSVCANGGYGATSSSYTYTYTAVPLSAPTGLSFNNNYPYTVSWNAVPGATSYWYETSSSSPTNINGTSVTDPDAELSNGQTYQVTVSATNGCVTSPYSSPALQVVMPPACGPAPTVSNVEGTYINLYAVSGAASYNVGFENTSGTIVYEVKNIGPIITTSGYQITGVPEGSYYIIAQTNCTNGGISLWGSPYFGGLQTIYSTKQLSDSMANVTISTNPPIDSNITLSVYPNPSRSQVNIVYNTSESGAADISITTEFGSTVLHKAITTIAGQNSYSLNIGQLSDGIYIIRLTDRKNVRYQKLMVAK